VVFFLSALWWIRIRGLYNFLMGGTAAAAKSSQSCPTLCNPIEGSPLGSSVPGILQARILEWVAISFSSAWKWKVKVKLLSHARLLATLSTAVYQAPPSMGFSRQEYWSGVPFPSPMGGTGYGENPVLLWWAGPCSVNLQSNFLLMGGAVLLLYSLAWAQTMIGVMATSSKRIYASILCLPALLLSVLLVTQQATVNPWLHQRFQTLTGKYGSVPCGLTAPVSWVLEHTRFCLCPPSVSGRYEVWLNTIGSLQPSWWGCSFVLGCGVCFLVGSNILLLIAVQQLVESLVFSQEKISICPFTLPSWSGLNHWLLVNGLNFPLLSLPLEIRGWSESSSLLITWLVSLEAAPILRLPRGFPKVTPLI